MPGASGRDEYQYDYRDEHQEAGSGPKIWRRVLVVCLLIVALLIFLYVGRLAVHGWGLYQNARQIEATLQTNWSTTALPVLGQELQQIAETTAAMERQVAPLNPLLSQLDGVTAYGSTVAAGPQLMAAGVEFIDIANQATEILTPALLDAGEDLDLDALFAALAQAGPELAEFAPQAEEANARLAAINAAQLHPALAEPFGELQLAAPLLSAGLQLAPHATDLLGFESPKTYLILVQNNHELRATGGFISAVGRLTLDQGRIADLDFQDSYKLYDKEGEYPAAPPAMQTYMDIAILLLRDANWSPDLPTTSHLVRSLYQQETGSEIDGVVTIDLHAVELLVDALGRLKVEGVDQPITGGNIAEIVTTLWAQPIGTDAEVDEEVSGQWWQQRKNFVPALANAALARVESGNVDLTAMARAGLAALDSRSVQVWLADPAASAILHDAGWDGAIDPPDEGDFLALVDTNMGYNKVNAVLQRELTHQVNWPSNPDETALAKTTIIYRHPVEMDGHVCDQSPRYGETYDEMMARCYFGYVRLYVPGGSQLIDAEGFDLDTVTSKRGERGTELFAGWFVLPPGDKRTVSYTYRLPPEITEENYQLAVQRQSGAGPLPLNGWIGDTAFETVVERGRFEWQPE